MSEGAQRRSPAAGAPAETLPPKLALAFAPLHKRAFGWAIGSACGVLVFAVTAVPLILRPAHEFQLALLAQYFYGYTVSWPGAFVGLAWGVVVGFVAGWFTAFCRNLVVAASMFLVRTRADLRSTREFLDHI